MKRSAIVLVLILLLVSSVSGLVITYDAIRGTAYTCEFGSDDGIYSVFLVPPGAATWTEVIQASPTYTFPNDPGIELMSIGGRTTGYGSCGQPTCLDPAKQHKWYVTSDPGAIPPVANFSYAADPSTPLTELYSDASTGGTPTSWRWDFGDGSFDDPGSSITSYNYASAGTYNVKLTVTNPSGSSNITKSVTVVDTSLVPAGTFSITTVTGAIGRTITLTDTSSNVPTTSTWNITYPDGSLYNLANGVTSSSTLPLYGTYTIWHTASNAYGSSTKVDYASAGSVPTPVTTYPTPTPTPAPTIAPTPVVIPGSACVTWNKANYIVGENAIVTTTLLGAYANPSIFGTATITLQIRDAYDNLVSSYPISTITQTIPLTLSSTAYSSGTYRAILQISPVPGTDTWTMMFADATLSASNVGFSGFVFDSSTGLVISGANVSMTQGSVHSNVNTAANGSYTSLATFIVGSPIALNVSKVGYDLNLGSFIPYSATIVYGNNYSLTPTAISYTGIALKGTVIDSTYRSYIPFALITAMNTTTGEYYYRYSNAQGLYLMDDASQTLCRTINGMTICEVFPSITFTSGRPYEIWGSKTGYANSSVYLKTVTAV